MDKFTISIFDNKTFFQIIKEIELFSKYKINHYEDFNLCIKDAQKGNHVVIFFINSLGKINEYNFPCISVVKSINDIKKLSNILNEKIKCRLRFLILRKKLFRL